MIIQRIKEIINPIRKEARMRVRRFFRPPLIIGGRIACVGKDILLTQFPGRDIQLFNIQKGRIDLLLAWIQNNKKIRASEAIQYLKNEGVQPMIEEQEEVSLLKMTKCPVFLFDTYSDLTDQKYTHRKEGWSFCSHYNDLKHSHDFNATFESNGLLELSDLKAQYLAFFSWLEKRFQGIQIIIVHYSTKFDDSPTYKNRAPEIKRVCQEIAAINKNVINLIAEDALILPHESDTFPYHYSKQTVQAFCKQIPPLGV